MWVGPGLSFCFGTLNEPGTAEPETRSQVLTWLVPRSRCSRLQYLLLVQRPVYGHQHGLVFETACVFGRRQRAFAVKALGHKGADVAMELCDTSQPQTTYVLLCTPKNSRAGAPRTAKRLRLAVEGPRHSPAIHPCSRASHRNGSRFQARWLAWPQRGVCCCAQRAPS
jgi:hypothetical protein